MILIILCYVVIISMLTKGCTTISKSGGGSFMKGLGKEIREIQDDFNNGYEKN